jgi:hypothetical protein
MTIHQCPKCELRFEWKTELDDHCWHDHPEFRHEYPAQPPPPPPVAHPAPRPHPVPEGPTHIDVVDGLLRWLVPPHPDDHTHMSHPPTEPVSENNNG